MKIITMKSNFLMLIFLILCGTHVNADTWVSPKTKEYFSADSSYFIRIVPTKIPDKYYEWLNARPKKKKKYSEVDTTIIYCHALFYNKNEGSDSLIWSRKLINRIAPETAIISNDGTWVVTFDNWGALGLGDNVLVCYNATGDFQFRTNLEFISPFPLNDFERSVSSLWWRCGQLFKDAENIEICFSTENGMMKKAEFNLNKLNIQSKMIGIKSDD
jgi:hypothetical protein